MSFPGPLFLPDLINRNHPLARGLVSYWQVIPGLDGGQTFFDLVGNNHGTLANGTLWAGPNSRLGGFGSLAFAGGTQKVTAPLATQTYPFSFGGWMNANGAGYHTLADCALRVWLGVDNAGNAGWRDETSGTFYTVSGSFRGSWHHYFLVVNGSGANQATLYIDGIPVLTGTQTVVPDQGQIVLGYWATAGNALNGNLDDVRFYNRALSATEISQLYNESIFGNPTFFNRVKTNVFGSAGSLTTVSTQDSLLWNVLQLISKSDQLVWNVLTSVSKQDQMLWNVLQQITKQDQLLWNVAAPFVIINTVYNLLMNLQTEKSFTGNILTVLQESLEWDK